MAREALAEVVNEVKYSGYIRRQDRMLRKQVHLDALECPPDMDFGAITALSVEAREKLQRFRPETLGQAARIDGVRAGDLAVLSVHVQRARAARHGADAGAGARDHGSTARPPASRRPRGREAGS
jgi:tRNA uridine 5-carboxymethylaminomethyl modification enzyme